MISSKAKMYDCDTPRGRSHRAYATAEAFRLIVRHRSKRSAAVPTDSHGLASPLQVLFILPILVLLSLCALVGDASGEERDWLIVQNAPEYFGTPLPVDDMTLDHIKLSLADRRLDRNPNLFSPSQIKARRKSKGYESCDTGSFLDRMPDVRYLPNWVVSELDECRIESSSSLDTVGEILPRLSIDGSFFSVSYSLELDVESRGLFFEYGGFTLGLGQSGDSATLFHGATFGWPRWIPGSRLIPLHIRNNVQFNAGVMLPIDTIDILEWRPQFGLGVSLLEW